MSVKQLDEGTRRALLAGQDPPAGAQERVLRAILAAGPPGGGGEPSAGDPSAGGGGGGELVTATSRGLEVGFAAKLVGATIGLTTAGLVTLALASAGVRSLRAAEPVPGRAHAVEVAERVEPAPRSREAPVREPVATPEPASSPAPREASPPAPKSSSSSSGSSRASAPATTTSLEAELALMQAARDAKAAATKLELLERHAREFGQGVLADEREVLRVETLCALGRKTDAEALAAAFVAAKPSNPLRSRVEPACKK